MRRRDRSNGSIGLTLVAMLCLPLADGLILAQSGQESSQVRFDRNVQPLLTKHGCNSGSCHGNSQGKGGFRLSLFGADPKWDYSAIVDADSSRVDTSNPEQSLLLRKPTGRDDHEGGVRITADSRDYQVLLKWIRTGAKPISQQDPLVNLQLQPPITRLTSENPLQRFHVIATFATGDSLDITEESTWRIKDDRIVRLHDSEVQWKAGESGEVVLVASYQGWSSNARVLVPREPPIAIEKRALDSTSGSGLVDQSIDKHLRELGLEKNGPCDDFTFLRRLYLSTLGQLPKPDEVRVFDGSKDPNKRATTVDACLDHPLHASRWATRWCEILGSREEESEANIESDWHAWLHHRFRENTRIDTLTRAILTATSRESRTAMEFLEAAMAQGEQDGSPKYQYALKPSLDLYWKRSGDNEQVAYESIAERTAAAFLGVRIECAKCHKHPFDRWTQEDYRSFASIFSQVRWGKSPDLRVAVSNKLEEARALVTSDKRLKVPVLKEIYVVSQAGHPSSLALGNPVVIRGDDRRVEFTNWLLDPANPYFAKNFVNRVWHFYFGRGLVEPVDAFSESNPASHPELLTALAESFVQDGFDLRKLERQILLSNAWQRDATPNVTDSKMCLYEVFPIRVLSAEEVVDSLQSVLLIDDKLAVNGASYAPDEKEWSSYFELFSRPARKLRCDCERSSEPTLRQAMLMSSDEWLLRKIASAIEFEITSNALESESWIEGCYLRCLARLPTVAERQTMNRYFAKHSDCASSRVDMLWSLINTREFITLH